MKKEPFFCLETAQKLLTFSRVTYYDTSPPAAEKHVTVDSQAMIEDLKNNVAEACTDSQQVRTYMRLTQLGVH